MHAEVRASGATERYNLTAQTAKLQPHNTPSYLGQPQPHDNIFKVIVLLLYTLLEKECFNEFIYIIYLWKNYLTKITTTLGIVPYLFLAPALRLG